jgi:CRISPR-associated protein Cmr6
MNLPLYRQRAPDELPDGGHRGLWYDRFFNRYNADWTIPEDGKSSWIKDNAKQVGENSVLEIAAQRHLALITALGGHGAVFKTDWHFATGLGLPHPVENGLVWHHTLGVPYLAGSGVKGLVKAWVEVWDESLDATDKAQRLRDWFGDLQQAGRFRFFDALPIAPVQLAPDIMTPHQGKWYEQGGEIDDWRRDPDKVPADWHAPVPVPFLVVKQARLLFGIAPRRPSDADALSDVFSALKQALDWLGAGAKTAAGYGRMIEDTAATDGLKQDAAKAVDAIERAKLSPEEQQLRDLADLFAAEKQRGAKEAGGPLIGATNQLLKDGNVWPDRARTNLADLAEAIYGYVGWGNTQKKQERKARIAALRAAPDSGGPGVTP